MNPFLKTVHSDSQADPILSSSPAFATPVHPVRSKYPKEPAKPSVLPIQLPPSILRPQVHRTLTQKHNLNFNSTALQILAAFIGKHCGSGWRQDGLAEKVLDETAKAWKKNGGGVIVSGDDAELNNILRSLEASMVGGRFLSQGNLSRQSSFHFQQRGCDLNANVPAKPGSRDELYEQQNEINDTVGGEEEEIISADPRQWLNIINAFDQPHLLYNPKTKHFEAAKDRPTLLADAMRRTQLFRNRYNLVHQRLLRDDRFQVSAVSVMRSTSLQRSLSSFATTQEAYRLTPIANLLGRSGSEHLLLGLLATSPTGNLTISDLTGSIPLDVQHVILDPPDSAWFMPGMIVVISGIYEEDESMSGESLENAGGVGGSIGGKFIAFSMGGPPCEPRNITLGIGGWTSREVHNSNAGFGWTDFLGLGSERAIGPRMKRLEKRVFTNPTEEAASEVRSKFVIMGDVHLDKVKTLQALKKILGSYVSDRPDDLPLTFILVGNFVESAVMAGGGSGGSIEYKEYFDALASTLSEYPTILQTTTFVFVPGDNDPWASSFSAGAASPLPRTSVPGLFTSRVKRAFATANAETLRSSNKAPLGEAIWTSNPSRLTLFGPSHEVVIFRDDMVGRLRRNAVHFRAVDATQDVKEPKTQVDGLAGMLDESLEDPSQTDVSRLASEASGLTMQDPRPGPSPNDSISSEDQRARKLVKTLLDQGYLSPFPLAIRPVLWDFANALHLYPLPTALILMDPEAPSFTVTYQGCHVMNPGPLVPTTRKSVAQWIEYDARSRRGQKKKIYL